MCKLDAADASSQVKDDKQRALDRKQTSTSSSSLESTTKEQSHFRFMFTLKSFELIDKEERPDSLSCFVSGLIIVLTLCSIEQTLRYILLHFQYLHPLLLNETNRYILARHVGVDTFSCAICCALGYSGRHLVSQIFDFSSSSSSSSKGKKKMLQKINKNKNDNDGDKNNKDHILSNMNHYGIRLFSYHPEAYRLALFFIGYQVKNTFDTINWNDGPEFIFHHLFSIFTALGSMNPGCGHMYNIFFFGISELSTAVLCLLANFDDIHGVPGLGNAFPVAKAILGIIFALCFIIFRCILWPIFGYYFVRDVVAALKNKEIDIRVQKRTFWLRFFLTSFSGLTILQIAWLGQIFIQGKDEFEKMGFL